MFPNHNFTGTLVNLDTIIMVKYTVDIKNNKMDISREVRKVFTSLWATPEVKVGLSIVFFLALTRAL